MSVSLFLQQKKRLEINITDIIFMGPGKSKRTEKVIFIVPISPISGKNASWMNFESTDQTDKIGW